MAQHNKDMEKMTGTKDTTYDVVSALYHALHGAENYIIYAQDAEQSGDQEVAQFFRDLAKENRDRSEKAKQLLSKKLM